MSERRLAMYPERPSELAESYVKAIEAFHRPPEFELNAEEKAEVIAFEHSLCAAEFPPGFEYLENRIEKPPKNISEITSMKTSQRTFCVDWFLQTPDGMHSLQKMGYEGSLISKNEIRIFLARVVPRIQKDNLVDKDSDHNLSDGYQESKDWARVQFEDKLRQEIENGSSQIAEPEYLTILREPENVIDKIIIARDLKAYYKTIEAGLRSSEATNVNDAKLVMLTMHRERINTLIAGAYRSAIPLIQQYRLSPEILSSEQISRLTDAFPVFLNVDTEDNEKMARLYSMIDKYISGIDVENGFSQISGEIERLQIELEKKPEMSSPPKSYDAKRFEGLRLDEKRLKAIVKKILARYGLLSEEEKYSSKRKARAEDEKWQVVTSKVRGSLSVNSRQGVVWIPKHFSRTLDQKKPTGILPLLDHEITHVLQHENAAKLGIGLLESNRAARGSLWFETGATFEENQSFLKNFGIERGTNFHYLRAMKAQLEGGSISDCIKVFYESLMSSGDTQSQDDAITTAVDRTLRLFRNGSEWTPGSGYLTNTEPLEYAEQQVLAKNMPKDLDWLYFVGRANFQTLAELYRIGWLNKDDVFVPDKAPSEIALEQLAIAEAGGELR